MLSYQHGYHAGHMTDVIKHLVLTNMLTYMKQKEKPFLYLETHAGRGIYSLKNTQAQKNKAYRSGILPLWSQKNQLPSGFEDYLQVIEAVNPKSTLDTYPGSPYFALALLRPQDRLVFCELHPKEFEALSSLPKRGKRVQFLQQDGLLTLKSQLPPAEKRALIFLDPSFELKTEYRELPKALFHAYQRFPQGVFCLWYPILKSKDHLPMLHKLKTKALTNTLNIEFLFPTTSEDFNLCGTGLWIMNPPYTLHKEIEQTLSFLSKITPKNPAKFTISSIEK